MRMTMAGAALAAVVGTCALAGGAQRAEAAYLVGFNYSAQTDAGGAIVVYTVQGTYQTGYQILDYTLETRYDRNGNSSVRTDNFHGTALGGYFTYIDQSGYPEYNFSVFGQHLIAFDDSYSGGGYATTDTTGPLLLRGGVNSVTEISGVPLPAAAPLFGAALLMFGGATYARRRFNKA